MDPREMLVTGHCRGHVRFHSGIRGKDTLEFHLRTGVFRHPKIPCHDDDANILFGLRFRSRAQEFGRFKDSRTREIF